MAAFAGAAPAAGPAHGPRDFLRARAAADANPDIPLTAPGSGADVADGTSVTLSWTAPWSCAACDIEEGVFVSTDANLTDESYYVRSFCPASGCPTTLSVGPLRPGTYYWAVVLWVDTDVHFSAISSFTVGAGPPAAVTPPVPSGGSVYTDSATDGGGASNISAVVVSDDPAAGTVSMRVYVPGFDRPRADDLFFVYVDVDQNPHTGDAGRYGTEFRIRVGGATGSVSAGRWNGDEYSAVAGKAVSVRYEPGAFVLTVDARELGDGKAPAGFNFWAGTYRTSGPFLFYDWAPDVFDWNYRLTPARKTTAVESMNVVALPAAPTAGLPFRIVVPRVTLANGASRRPDRLACTATLGGAALRGREAGGCTFTLPGTAAAKTFVVRVTAGYGGARLVRTLRFKVAPG